MYNYSKLSYQLKREIKTFSSKISKGLSAILNLLTKDFLLLLPKFISCTGELRNITALRSSSLDLRIFGTFAEKQNDSILVFHIIECSKRIFDKPKFIFYALGDGIFNILKKTKEGVRSFMEKTPQSQQLDIFKAFKLKDPSAFWSQFLGTLKEKILRGASANKQSDQFCEKG
jgi:hypothetical protein